MGVPAGVTHVVFGGTLPGGEVWESGFWTYGNNPTDGAAANTLAGLWAAQLTATDASGALRLTAVNIWDVGTTFTYVKVYVYNTASAPATIVGAYTQAPYAGTLSTRTLPNQCSLVVSTKTGLAGRRNRGRMYLPIGGATSTGGQLTTATITTIANAWATCFSDWNASGDNGVVVVVSSAAGAEHPVTQLTVDSRVDIQRRRANKQLIASSVNATVT